MITSSTWLDLLPELAGGLAPSEIPDICLPCAVLLEGLGLACALKILCMSGNGGQVVWFQPVGSGGAQRWQRVAVLDRQPWVPAASADALGWRPRQRVGEPARPRTPDPWSALGSIPVPHGRRVQIGANAVLVEAPTTCIIDRLLRAPVHGDTLVLPSLEVPCVPVHPS